MKKYAIIALLISPLVTAEDFPLRDPAAGESRPDWWWDCWANPIVVIEGTLFFEHDNKPDVEVKISDEAAKKELDEEERELEKTRSKFYIGTIVPKKIVFLAPGISTIDTSFESLDKLKVLIPLSDRHDGRILLTSFKNGQNAVYVFRYGSQMASFPMIAQFSLTQKQLVAANKIFEYRTKSDYRFKAAEPVGAVQPATAPEAKPECKDKPNPESKARPQ